MRRTPESLLTLLLFAVVFAATPTISHAQCTQMGPVNNFTGSAQTVCPCFIAGEQAGVVLDVPANEYPIEITKIGIAWASQFGGNPSQIEQALYIYPAGLPNPGAPIFTLLGPQLADGFLNEFDLTTIPGNKVLNSGPFTVALEFLNSNSGDIFAPSVVHDGNGCQAGKNAVFANPGGWLDACLLGVTGDWVMYVYYRSLAPNAGVTPTSIAYPSLPAYQTTCDTVTVYNDGCDTLTVTGIGGCDTAPFSIDTTSTSHSIPPGDSTTIIVCATPTMPGGDMCDILVYHDATGSPLQVPVDFGLVTAVRTPDASGLDDVTIYPNPFNPSTTVHFNLASSMPVTAAIFDVSGRLVRTLADDLPLSTGENSLHWDGRDNSGQAVASGIYMVRIATPLGTRVARAVLLK